MTFKKEELKFRLKVFKLFMSIFLGAIFMVLTKVKITPILGTKSKFSLAAFFGPSLQRILGIKLGILTILLAEIFGLITGFYKIKNFLSYLIFLPILAGGFYFAKIFEKKKKLIVIPTICIVLFILHPIGRKVWFYSLFWIIPVLIAVKDFENLRIFKKKFLVLYAYSLGAAFVDHAIGSTLYLYYFNIREEFWIKAIPYTIVERIIMALGLEFSYLSLRFFIKNLERIFEIVYEVQAISLEKKVEEKITAEEEYQYGRVF